MNLTNAAFQQSMFQTFSRLQTSLKSWISWGQHVLQTWIYCIWFCFFPGFQLGWLIATHHSSPPPAAMTMTNFEMEPPEAATPPAAKARPFWGEPFWFTGWFFHRLIGGRLSVAAVAALWLQVFVPLWAKITLAGLLVLLWSQNSGAIRIRACCLFHPLPRNFSFLKCLEWGVCIPWFELKRL